MPCLLLLVCLLDVDYPYISIILLLSDQIILFHFFLGFLFMLMILNITYMLSHRSVSEVLIYVAQTYILSHTHNTQTASLMCLLESKTKLIFLSFPQPISYHFYILHVHKQLLLRSSFPSQEPICWSWTTLIHSTYHSPSLMLLYISWRLQQFSSQHRLKPDIFLPKMHFSFFKTECSF